MSKVAEIKPVPRGYNEQVVDRLRKLLKRAEEGEILSLVCIIERPGCEYTTSMTGTDDSFSRLGAAARLVHEINRRMDELSEESDFVDGA